MAIAFVQKAGASGTGSVVSAAATFAGGSTVGNLIVVVIKIINDPGHTVTDGSGANTYSLIKAQANGSELTEIWAATNASASTLTVTLASTGGARAMGLGIAEFSGVGTAFGNNSATATSSAVAAGGVTSTTNGALYIGGMAIGLTRTITEAGTFTLIHEQETAANGPMSAIYQIQGTAGALDATWTLSANAPWAAVVAVWDPPATGAFNPYFYRTHVGGG